MLIKLIHCKHLECLHILSAHNILLTTLGVLGGVCKYASEPQKEEWMLLICSPLCLYFYLFKKFKVISNLMKNPKIFHLALCRV